ncbi:hypothetical protein HYALB_00008631 [Hymenoscyphus albidus]|uniref:Uncharacterized protein n=1 Tax=Hymenoscyphus albidus TaxID=595503 RepID=A0A9N9LHI9_9HELO|nr:hypothetical protein HYALB_00008631 [Hymenoscyphus albidus]
MKFLSTGPQESKRTRKLKDEAAFTLYLSSLPPTAHSPYPSFASFAKHQPQLSKWCRDRAEYEYSTSSDRDRKESSEDRYWRRREALKEFMMRQKMEEEEKRQREEYEEEERRRRKMWVEREMSRRGLVGRIGFAGKEWCRGRKGELV